MKRRHFIEKASLATLGLGLAPSMVMAEISKLKLPRWKGFNILDFFSPNPSRRQKLSTEEHFKWMADWGFNFVRLPMAYPYYLDFDRTKPITLDKTCSFDLKKTDQIEKTVCLAQKYGHHVSINLHRAPGYCINAGFQEPYNLWRDEQAQADFCTHWEFWAKKFKNQKPQKLSFDLLNEPSWRDDMNDQYGAKTKLLGNIYQNVIEKAHKTIKSVNKKHLVVADGNNVGNDVIDQVDHLELLQSCRGYWPGYISHHKASWVHKNPDALPDPTWPSVVNGQNYDKEALKKRLQPWVDLAKSGKMVHCGECGCFSETPHGVFLDWFTDLLSVFKEANIGFALWEFSGSFGILNSGRKDVAYEDFYGQKLDRKLLTLLQKM